MGETIMKGKAKRATLPRDSLEGGYKTASNLLLMVTGLNGLDT
jgi:hypothetical protein